MTKVCRFSSRRILSRLFKDYIPSQLAKGAISQSLILLEFFRKISQVQEPVSIAFIHLLEMSFTSNR